MTFITFSYTAWYVVFSEYFNLRISSFVNNFSPFAFCTSTLVADAGSLTIKVVTGISGLFTKLLLARERASELSLSTKFSSFLQPLNT
ncbi:Uncharacterised protein [Chlamydia trachomatis]|nr:Uncharacterised protein [Chlamydia trachomatis]